MRRQGGFTLIEVLLAIAILAVVLGMVYATFQQTSSLAAHVDEVSAEYRAARLAMVKISDELMAAYAFGEDTDGTFFRGDDAIGPNGLDADRLAFTTMARAVPEGIPASFHNAVAYRMEEGRLMHEEVPGAPNLVRQNPRVWPLIEGLAGFRLRYRGADEGWKDAWNPDLGFAGLPRAVEVTLFFPAKGQVADVDRDGYLALTEVVRVPMGGS